MGWIKIRKATDEDVAALDAAAVKFARKHIPYITEKDLSGQARCLASFIESCIEAPGQDLLHVWARERKLWRAQVQRTLGKGATGIAYGYVGYEVKKKF